MREVREGTFRYLYLSSTRAEKVRLGTLPFREYLAYLPEIDNGMAL